jgi:hypothetical protein
MRHHNISPWLSAGPAFLLLALVISCDMLVMTNRLYPGTHLLPSQSSLSALFRSSR